MKTSLLLASIIFVTFTFAQAPRKEISFGGHFSFKHQFLSVEAKGGTFLTRNHGVEIALNSIIFRPGNHFHTETMVNYLYNLPHHKITPFAFIGGGIIFPDLTQPLINLGGGLRFHLTDTANIRGQFVIERNLRTGYTEKYISTGISVYIR